MGVSQKTLELKCPKCQDLIRVKVDRSMLEEAKRLPIAVSYIHGDPMHSTTVWVDNDFVIRAVEAPDNTILGHGILTKGEHPLVPSSEDEFPGEAEITDEAIIKLEKALETVGKMSSEIVLVLTRAHDELTKLSELRKRRAASPKVAAERKTTPEARRLVRKVVRTQEPKFVKRDY